MTDDTSPRGVLFDTCGGYYDNDEKTIWYMLENNRVAAFESDGNVDPLQEGDVVFLYHRDLGVVAAGRVLGGVKSDPPNDAVYRDVEWLTQIPTRQQGVTKSIPAKRIKEIVGHDFYFAHTIKKPFLTVPESDMLLIALRELLN